MKRIFPEQESGIVTTLVSDDEYEKDKFLKNTSVNSCLNATQTYKYSRVWRRACFRIKVRKALALVNDEIIQYGTSSDFLDLNNKFKHNVEEILWKKKNKQEDYRLPVRPQEMPWHVIHPDSLFSSCWSIIIAVLLLYTAAVMPVRIAFFDVVFFDAWTITDMCVDVLFAYDIVVSSMTAFERKEGVYEIRHKKIFIKYLKTWFLFDTLACLPFSFIEYNSNDSGETTSGHYNNLIRLARVPRLYKLLRILRIAKFMKGFSNSSFIAQATDYLKANSSKP